jgi:hypothetical protein
VKVFFESLNFAGVLSGNAGTTKNSANFATLQTGKKYLMRAEVFARANSGLNYYLAGAVSASGATVTPITKFTTGNGYSYRASTSIVESRVSIVSTIDGSALTGANYELIIAITCGDPTNAADDQLSLSGYYTVEEVTSIN